MTSLRTSGVGSWPGSDIEQAVSQILQLVSIPYLPELPGRGPGSDMVGRALGLIGEFGFDLSPTGWRSAGRPSGPQRRAAARLRDDLDVLAERGEGYRGTIKVALCGWWTLAAVVELARGGPMLGDAGAVRDLLQAGRAAAGELVAQVRLRLPGADVVLQLDEPALPAVMAGGVPTQSGLGRLRVPDQELVGRSFQGLPEGTLVHSCAADIPVALLRQAGIGGVSLDGSLLATAGWDAVAEHLDSGGTVWLGLLPTDTTAVPAPDTLVARGSGWLRPLGLGPELLDRVILTPACGLSRLSVGDAVRATKSLSRAAELLAGELVG